MILKLNTRKMKGNIMYLLSFFLIIGLFSCTDDEFNMEKVNSEVTLKPGIALTIGTINIELQDFLKSKDSATLNQDADGTFYFLYEDNFLSYRGEDVIKLPVQQEVQIPAIAFPDKFETSTVKVGTSFDVDLLFSNDQQIEKVLLKKLAITIHGTYKSIYENTSLDIEFLTIKNKNNDTLLKYHIPMAKLTSGATAPLNYDSDPSIANDFIMTFKNTNSGKSVLPVKVSMSIKGNAGEVITEKPTLIANFGINDIHYRTMFGYMGQFEILDYTSSIDLTALSNNMAKNIEWKKPEIQLHFNNSYGLPIRFDFQNLSVLQFGSADEMIVTPTLTEDEKNIRYILSETDASKKDTLSLTKENSSKFFHELENAPSQLNYHIKAVCNYDGNVSNNNILKDTSELHGKFRIKVPLEFRSSGLENVGVMDFNLFGDGNKTGIDSMLFRIVSNNQLPIDMLLQLQFLDEDSNIIAELFKNVADSSRRIIKGGKVDANGNVTPSEYVQNIYFGSEALKGISKAKKIVYKTTIVTSDYDIKNKTGPYVKFKDGYKLKMSFICQLKARVTL